MFGGTGERWNLETNTQLSGTTAPKATEEPDRADWTQPLVFSKADPRALYYASQFLFKSTDGAKSVDADQPRPHARRIRAFPRISMRTAAAHVDRNGKRGVIYTIAPSPLLVPIVWVGTDDGLVQLTPNDGQDVAERDAGRDHGRGAA